MTRKLLEEDGSPSAGIPGLVDGHLSAQWDHSGALCLSVAARTSAEVIRVDCLLHGEDASAIWGLLTGQAVRVAAVPCGVGVRFDAAPVRVGQLTATAKE